MFGSKKRTADGMMTCRSKVSFGAILEKDAKIGSEGARVVATGGAQAHPRTRALPICLFESMACSGDLFLEESCAIICGSCDIRLCHLHCDIGKARIVSVSIRVSLSAHQLKDGWWISTHVLFAWLRRNGRRLLGT